MFISVHPAGDRGIWKGDLGWRIWNRGIWEGNLGKGIWNRGIWEALGAEALPRIHTWPLQGFFLLQWMPECFPHKPQLG